MADNQKALAIIPARKGSKRLPGKNMLPLAGKPLIQWTIEAAQQSNAIDEALVTSDDPTVLKLATALGVEHVVNRPAELASDEAATPDVIRHAIEYLERNDPQLPTEICLLQATSPLRTAQDIDAAFALYAKSHAPAAISVCEVDHPLAWCGELDESLSMRGFAENVGRAKRSQDQPHHYRLNGAIYISETRRFLETRDFLDVDAIACVMPRERSIDIDNRLDFIVAEAVMGAEL